MPYLGVPAPGCRRAPGLFQPVWSASRRLRPRPRMGAGFSLDLAPNGWGPLPFPAQVVIGRTGETGSSGRPVPPRPDRLAGASVQGASGPFPCPFIHMLGYY